MSVLTERQPTHRRPNEGKAVRARGDVYIFKALAAETQGAYSLVEGRHVPGGGVPLHRHHLDEEGFFVLEGTYEFQLGDHTITAGPGEFIHVPRPTPHAFRNIGDGPGRVLVVISPGGYHEQYFEEAWEPISDPSNLPPPSDQPPDFAKIAAALQRAGMEMLPTPGERAGH
jgi:quercetin dioxygenase-like cupin family protein